MSATCGGSHDRIAAVTLSEGERCSKFHSRSLNGTSCGARLRCGHVRLIRRWSRKPAILPVALPFPDAWIGYWGDAGQNSWNVSRQRAGR